MEIFWFFFLSLFNLILCGSIQTSYHWHLQQPIYWPAPIPTSPYTYQKAYDSIQWKSKQGGHPQNDLDSIFQTPDRVAVYQYRAADSIDSCKNAPNMGAQVSYSGCLIENVNSLADNNYNGGLYIKNWNATYARERLKKTSGGFPKMDLVSFTYHHTLAPLIEKNALEKEIQIHKVIYEKTWNTQDYSKGFFPAEMAFSERIIPTLVKQGIEWVFVADNHVSRCCENYPYSPPGDNNNPPNPADQINPPQYHWFNQSVSRGVTPRNAVPFSLTPHYAKHVDPDTNQEYKIIVVPVEMAMSWDDGYACYGTQDIQSIAAYNNPTHPMLIVFAHDGDNDFGGGYTYYTQCVSSFVQQAISQGYNPTTVQQYLTDYPVDESDIVHIEDGAWINADGDFGAPRFINWNWPLTGNGSAPDFDIPDGWQVNERNWAVITAAENVVETAEKVAGGVRITEIQQPSTFSTDAEKAWHFFLPSMTSGYMYYGAILDMYLKQTVAANVAVSYALKAINSSNFVDITPPSIWYVMRHPYNPGGYGMGSLYKYKYTRMPNDFYIYTFAFDISGISKVTLYLRQDQDGKNPLNDNANEVYEPAKYDLSGVGPWQTYSMIYRQFPKGDQDGIHFEILPTYIADEYYYHVTGKKNILLDYYVEATDTFGNVKRSDIYHVYVGDNSTNIHNMVY